MPAKCTDATPPRTASGGWEAAATCLGGQPDPPGVLVVQQQALWAVALRVGVDSGGTVLVVQ